MKDYSKTKWERLYDLLLLFIFVAVISYCFLALVNWSFSLKDWNGFSRFIIGVEGIVFLFKFFDEV